MCLWLEVSVCVSVAGYCALCKVWMCPIVINLSVIVHNAPVGSP